MSVTFTSQLRVSQGLMPSIWLLARERERKQEMGGKREERDTQSQEDKWG